MEPLLDKKETNQKAQNSPKRKSMKSVLGLNILLKNPSDTLTKRLDFKSTSTNYYKSHENETI
jgi:hypothetical protein